MSVSATPKISRRSGKAQYFIERLSENVTLDMVLIPSGNFLMGSPPEELDRFDDESPQHQVSISTFFLGKYAITQAQYKAVMGNNPSHFKGEADSSNHPVENVSWNNATEFCYRLSKLTGKEYRLPSEAEWEYACRAGTTTPFHFGETISTELANYQGTDKKIGDALFKGNYGRGSKGIYRGKTTPVGSFKVANAFGLFDMHGNVWEWCADNWHSNYEDIPDSKEWVEGSDKEKHPLRGGSWDEGPPYCRSACRFNSVANVRILNIGFRVVCSARGLL
jgi:formylglycine-generating enzyme required for sulfatase activity